MQVSAADNGELHSTSPWLYVNSNGPLKGQGIGAAPVRNNDISIASVGSVLHIIARLGFDDSTVQKARKNITKKFRLGW